MVAQWPNTALIVWIATSVVLALSDPDGTWGLALRVVAMVALGWWAVDEIVRGVNPWLGLTRFDGHPRSGAKPRRGCPSMETMGRTKRPRRSFTKEFKAEVVELVRQPGNTAASVARDLDLTETAVREWVKQADIDDGHA